MAGGPSWQGTEIHDIDSKTYTHTAHNIAAKVQQSNTTFNYNMLTFTFKNDSRPMICLQYDIMNTVSTGKVLM